MITIYTQCNTIYYVCSTMETFPQDFLENLGRNVFLLLVEVSGAKQMHI